MDQQDIAALEALAGLELEPAEREALRRDLQAMVRLAEELAPAESAEGSAEMSAESLPEMSPETSQDQTGSEPPSPIAADTECIRANFPCWQDPFIDVPAPSRNEDESAP